VYAAPKLSRLRPANQRRTDRWRSPIRLSPSPTTTAEIAAPPPLRSPGGPLRPLALDLGSSVRGKSMGRSAY
jgi:hypothetical protein